MQRVTLGGSVRDHPRGFPTKSTPRWTSGSAGEYPADTWSAPESGYRGRAAGDL